MTDRNGATGVTEGLAFLEVRSSEPINRLDLRCVAGLRIALIAHDDCRWPELLERLTEFGPPHVGIAAPGYTAQWTPENGLGDWN